MKKILSILSAFLPLLVVLGIILLFQLFQTLKMDTILEWAKDNWIECSIAYTLGVCCTKFTSKLKVKRQLSIDDD